MTTTSQDTRPDLAQTDAETHAILVVDDEDYIHTLGRRILEREGYVVFCASDRMAALDLLRTEGHRIRLAVLDVLMPDVEGPELALQLRQIQPDLRLLFSSGYGVTPEVRSFMEDGRADFIAKPFTRDAILEKVQSVIG